MKKKINIVRNNGTILNGKTDDKQLIVFLDKSEYSFQYVRGWVRLGYSVCDRMVT